MSLADYTLPESVEIRAESSLPTALDTERGILGCILLNNLHLADAMAICHIEDFALDSHRVILRRMIAMESASMAIDYLTLTAELSRNREIESVGGYAYIASFTEGLPNRLNISEYADEIVEKSMRRQTIVLGSELARRATDSVETSSELLAWANNRTMAICEHIEQASLESQSDDEFELLMKQHHGETALFPAIWDRRARPALGWICSRRDDCDCGASTARQVLHAGSGGRETLSQQGSLPRFLDRDALRPATSPDMVSNERGTILEAETRRDDERDGVVHRPRCNAPGIALAADHR